VQPGITLPANTTAITINSSGQVQATVPGQVNATIVGQLSLSLFPNEPGLLATGNNLLVETAASGTPQATTPGANGSGTIQQGFLETSNVNVVSEITNLITAQRAYEMNSKVVEASNQMSQTLTNMH
jgi:flagellar basal-body rod protein FlgG